MRSMRAYAQPAAAAVGILAGGLLYPLAGAQAADVAWAATVAIMLVPLSWSVAALAAARRRSAWT